MHGKCRAQSMAEAYFKKFIGERFNILGADLEPQEVYPLAKAVMNEDEINIDDQRSKGVEQFLGETRIPSRHYRLRKNREELSQNLSTSDEPIVPAFEDPSAYKESDNETLEKFREIRNQIKARIQEFVQG